MFESFPVFTGFHASCLFTLLQFFSFLEYLTLFGSFQVFTGFGLPAPFGLVQSADFAGAFFADFETVPPSPLFLSLCFPACTSGARDARAILQIK